MWKEEEGEFIQLLFQYVYVRFMFILVLISYCA